MNCSVSINNTLKYVYRIVNLLGIWRNILKYTTVSFKEIQEKKLICGIMKWNVAKLSTLLIKHDNGFSNIENIWSIK